MDNIVNRIEIFTQFKKELGEFRELLIKYGLDVPADYELQNLKRKFNRLNRAASKLHRLL